MSVLTVRGGIPYVIRESIATTGRKVRLPFFISFLKIRVETNPVRLYFTEEDFNANVNYVLVQPASAIYPYGQWEGPVETCAGDRSDLWLRGDGGPSAVELVAFQRRG